MFFIHCPGTQALANQMGYRMDLGLVTSKYIGETEKNVESLFAGANNPRITRVCREFFLVDAQVQDVQELDNRCQGTADRLRTNGGQVGLWMR